MDARLLDVIIGVIAFLILIALLAILPLVITAGIAYLAAIIVFMYNDLLNSDATFCGS